MGKSVKFRGFGSRGVQADPRRAAEYIVSTASRLERIYLIRGGNEAGSGKRRSKSRCCHHDPDDRFCILDLAAADHFKHGRKCVPFDGENFVCF